MSKIRSRSSYRAAAASALVVLTLAAFWPVLDLGFINFDDPQYVTKNPRVQEGIGGSPLAWALTATYASNWHPLTWISHMLDWQLYGDSARGHHLSSLILHVLNTLLLFFFLERTTGSTGRSALAAALFGVHPLRVESVAWIAERKDVLSTFFWMLALVAYAGYVKRPRPARYLAVILAFVLGLAAKPMLVSLPIVLLIIDFWPLARWDRSGSGDKARWLLLEKSPLIGLSVVSSAVTVWAQHVGESIATVERYPLAVRLSNACLAYAAYLLKTVWPSNLAVYYPHPGQVRLLPALISAAGLALATVVAIRARRRFPYLFAGWLWYVVTLIPVIGLVQVGSQAMADRYTYVPHAGLFIVVAWGAYDIAARLGSLDRAAWTAPVVVGLLVLGTRAQLRYWRDSVALFERALAVTRNNSMVQWSLGSALADQKRFAEAIEHYRRAIEIHPEFAEAHESLGAALAAEKRYEEAIQHYERALAVRPVFPRARTNLGHALERLGLTAAALEQYELAIRQDPQRPGSYNDAGAALLRLGRAAEAVEVLGQALRFSPDNGKAHSNLAAAFYALGRYEEAWREVRLARSAGFEPPAELQRLLAERMPDANRPEK